MKRLEIKSIDHTETHQIWVNNEPYLLKGFEANLVSVLRKLPAKTRIQLMNLSEDDCLQHFKEKREHYREVALELLGRKWFDRETDMKFTLKNFECEFIEGFPTYQKVKNDIKKDKLTIDQLSKVINFFTEDYSELYNKD